jgi:hypothetical protein
MDSTLIESEIREALDTQKALSGDETVAAAAELLLQVLGPALRGATHTLATQASQELNAQFGYERVTVSLEDGDPILQVTDNASAASVSTSDLDARITVRLPDALKEAIELAANDDGDSVNTLILKTLSSRQHRAKGKTMNLSVDL